MDNEPPRSQALIARKPTMSQKEFSDHWYNKHAPLVLPYFLSFGFQYYAQTHGPLTSKNEEVKKILGGFDGAAESIHSSTSRTEPESAWKKAYYDEVIRPDERRFLVSEALHHFKVVPAGSVEGEKRVVIQDGKAVIDVPEDGEVMRVWREYEARGRKEAEGQ